MCENNELISNHCIISTSGKQYGKNTSIQDPGPEETKEDNFVSEDFDKPFKDSPGNNMASGLALSTPIRKTTKKVIPEPLEKSQSANHTESREKKSWINRDVGTQINMAPTTIKCRNYHP